VILTPKRYPEVSAYELLEAAARGHVAIDHRFLHALLDEPERTLPDIVRFATELEERDDRFDLEEDLVLIARHLHRPELIPFLMERVRRAPDDVPEFLVETICSFREGALEPLLELHREIGPKPTSEIPFLLASLGVKDERIERALAEAAEAGHEDADFFWTVYHDISEAADEPEPFDIYEHYPEEEPPPFLDLEPEERLEFLEAEDPELRAAAVMTLGDEADLSPEVLERLRETARRDPDARVRGAAWRALALEIEDEQLHEEMRERLQQMDTPPEERAGLIVALAPDAYEHRVRRRVLELFENPETKPAAVEAMWRSADRTFGPQVREALDDPDPRVREQALMGVGYLQMKGELGRVKAMFDDPRLRPAALMAYALAMPTKVTPGHMRSLLKKIEQAAGGLDAAEAHIVQLALNQRLRNEGYEPIFGLEE